MKMELSALSVAGSDEVGRAGHDIIAWAARQAAFDYRQLLVEAQSKAQTLKGSDTISVFDGLLVVDAPVKWSGSIASNPVSLLKLALLHPSEWIVQLAVNLAAHCLTIPEIQKLVQHVLATAKGVGVAAASHLAVEFLGEDKARELFVERLKQPLSSGCKYLFPYLAKVWDPTLDEQIEGIIRPAIFFGPRNAKAALDLVRLCGEPSRKTLVPFLEEAYEYWLKHEGPYPKAGGVIPESPRGEIIQIRIAADAVNLNDLFTAAKDVRSEVSKAASDALVKKLSSSETARNDLIRRMRAGEELHALLRTCLHVRTPFSNLDIESIAQLLDSSRPRDRHAALGILQIEYLSPDKIRQWLLQLTTDPYQQIRDKAHECISLLGKPINGEAS